MDIRGIIFDKDGTLFDFVFQPDSPVIAGTAREAAECLASALPGRDVDQIEALLNAKAALAPLAPAVPLDPFLTALVARGLRLRPPTHFGEDWNGRGGGNTDLGDPVYTVADGVVTFAHDVRQGWGNVVLIRHAYREPKTGQVRYCDSLYGHLRDMPLKNGQEVKRGERIGSIGTNRGMYTAHLHFEIRHNLSIGMHRNSVPRTLEHWADPTDFIKKYRRLNREWGKQAVPIGTFKDYNGFKGL